MRLALGVGLLALVLAAGCGATPTPPSPMPPSTTPPASPAVSCLGTVPAAACGPVTQAALGAVAASGKTPVQVWINTGFFCPREDCLFDPNQNFPYPQPPSGGEWVANVEIAFVGTDEHAGLHVAKVGETYVPVLIGFRVPLPGWCSGYCASPPPSPSASPSPIPTPTMPVGTPPTGWTHVPDAPALHLEAASNTVVAVAPDGTFVAIVSALNSHTPVALRSADGVSWAAAGPFPGARDMQVNASTRSGDTLIAVGTGGATTGGAAWTSRDGVTWQRVADQPAFALGGLDRVAAGPAGLVAVDSFEGLLLVSADGASWSSTSLGTAGAVKVDDVAATEAGFVAVGSVGTVAAAWTSSDGEHWARASFPDGSDANARLVSVAAAGQRLVALGAVPAAGEAANDPWSGMGAWVSTDGGASWTQSGTTLRGTAPALYGPSIPGLYALSGGFVALGNPGPGALAVWTSADGTSWRQSTVQNGSGAIGRTLAIAGGRAVIAGHDLGTGEGGSRAMFWTGELVALCRAESLAITGVGQGETGTVNFGVAITNTSSTVCSLPGLPSSVELLRSTGTAPGLTVKPPLGNASARVVLRPGVQGDAWLTFYWSNWCGPSPVALQVRLTFNGVPGSVTGPLRGLLLARCDHPEVASWIQVDGITQAGD